MAGVDGRPWVDGLPPALARHARLLRSLLELAESDARVRAFELQCSLARGAADELSDLDAGLWVEDEHLAAVEAELPELAARAGTPVDLLATRLGERPYLVAEYDDGVQLDLVVQAASRAKGRVPDSVVLLDRDGLLEAPYEPALAAASPVEREEWSFRGWLALSNVAKYLSRASLWEARASLESARGHLLQLHAARLGVRYPSFGLTALLDDEAPLPERLEETLATLDGDDLARAALVLAELLAQYAGRPLAAPVHERLSRAARATDTNSVTKP